MPGSAPRNCRQKRRIGLQNRRGQASLTRRILTNVISFRRKGGCGMRTVLFRGCLLALMLTAVLATSVSAQVDTGTLSGTIKDESGGVLPGATVTITHE